MGRGVVLAKSAALCFRLTAKMRSAPLLVLSPRDPLRWARAGPLIARPGTTLFVGRDDSARQTTPRINYLSVTCKDGRDAFKTHFFFPPEKETVFGIQRKRGSRTG